MPCVPRSRAARMVSLWLLVLHAQAPCLGRAPPAAGSPFPDGRQEQFVKTLPEYHVVNPARVDASGHFLSFNLHHHISNTRKKRDLGKNENVVYYKINHEEKDLFFNLTVHVGFLSHNYVVERRRGNHTNAKIATHSGVPCHFLGVAWQPGFEIGTAAISTCNGLQLELVEPSGWIHVPLTDTHKKPIRTFMIQIAVLANHQNGRDTHMRQIKVYTPVEESSIGKFPRCTTIDFMMYRSIR